MADGGVGRETERPTGSEPGTGSKSESESESGTGTETGTSAGAGAETETIGEAEPGEANGTTESAEPARPGAATATGLDGDEYTLSEEYALQREIERLRVELDAFEMEVEERVVDRDELESDLKSYVRKHAQSSKARGWGPYLVLLYGTAMTIAVALGDALSGGWAVFALLVIFLSTLGLYVVMVMVGLGISALSIPGKLRDTIGSLRS